MKKTLTSFLSIPLLFSFLDAADPLKNVSKKFQAATAKPAMSVAVLDFTYPSGRMSSGSRIVPERLTTYLVQSGARVVERRLIQQILEEKKLIQTGAVDLAQIQNQKNILGVDALVVGSLIDISDTAARLNARLIKVDTGEVLAISEVTIPRGWSDSPRLTTSARGRTPVPVTQFGTTSQMPTRQYTLGDTDRTKEKVRYYPAPVPFFLPTAARTLGEGKFK